MVENIARKGEIACCKQFSFSHNVFHGYIRVSLACQCGMCGNEFNALSYHHVDLVPV